MLTDAGPLLAMFDVAEPAHSRCAAIVNRLEAPLVTTWPVFTEAMYLVQRGGGRVGRRALWKLVQTDRLRLAELTPASLDRAAALMDKYEDVPMSLADASLVAIAEARGERRIFTLDSDFAIYRLHGRQRFDVLPG